MMGKENPSPEKLICSSWSSIEQEYNDSSSQEDIEGNDQQRKSNCLKDVVASSDAFMHISIRNDGDDHNHSMQKKKCFIVSFKNSKYKRKRNTKIFSSKFMALASSMLTIYLAFEFASIGVFLLHFSPGVAADFSDNCPSDCNCKWANGKREADCTRGGFTTIPTNLDHEIQILRMTHNYVRKLEKNIFHSTGLINLQRIFMNHCHVQEVHADAFRNLKIMVELDLSNNNISSLEPKTFTGCRRLQTLTLSHNIITELPAFAFPSLQHLKTIDLSHNKLTSIHKQAFGNLGNSVESINIDNNQLKTLREQVFVLLNNLKSLQLHTNPWNCDCRLKHFRDWVVEKGLYTYPTACGEPERLADRLWQDVVPKDFACKPEITVPQSVVFSQPGANVTLSCFIVGNPMPDAKWVLKGRIVNNNTAPSGASSSPSLPSSQVTPTTTTLAPFSPSRDQRKQGNKNATNPNEYYNVQTQFLIHEEGGLERWFNLTITNVGVESVADYTCVAVNAGGVMEENISLTFEEPDLDPLPGGKKEEDSLAIIIGAAAGGIFFVLVLLFVLCCCCCRRKVKRASPSSSTPSSSSASNIRTPDRHDGSVIGFSDSNSSQKLLLHQHQYPPQQQHHPNALQSLNEQHSTSSLVSSNGDQYHQIHDGLGQQQEYVMRSPHRSPSSPIIPPKSSISKHSRIGDYQGLPQHEMEPLSSTYQEQQNFISSHSGTNIISNMEHKSNQHENPVGRGGVPVQMEIIDQPQHQHRIHHQLSSPSHKQINTTIVQPKQLVVSSNNGPNGQNYHSSTINTGHQPAREQFPDLLNMQSTVKASPVLPHTRKPNQPLNPAALVLPPSPPLQFPHQFPHLIHPTGRSNATPHNSPTVTGQNKRGPPPPPPARSHSFENSFSDSPPESQIAPLLSPPAQFGQASFFDDKSLHKGYATLPRKLPHNNVTTDNNLHTQTSLNDTKRGLVDWSAMTDRVPVYDGVGPRTSATGSSNNVNKSEIRGEPGKFAISTSNNISNHTSDSKQSNRPKCDCPDILEFGKYNSKTMQNKPQHPPPQRSSSLRRAESSANKVNLLPNMNTIKESARRGDISVQNFEDRCIPHDPRRDSSGSDVTLANESMSGYFEPFGKALPPPPDPNGKGQRSTHSNNRDSIVSTESDLDSILGSTTSSTRRQSCPLHKTHPMLQYHSSKNAPSITELNRHGHSGSSSEVKHLKGILKGGSMNKPNEVGKATMSSTKLPSITTNPVALAVNVPQNTQKTVIVTSSVYRDKSMSPISSSAASSSPSPPPLAPLIDVVGGHGSRSNFNSSNKPQSQKLSDTNSMKIVRGPSTMKHSQQANQMMFAKQGNSSFTNDSSEYSKTNKKVLSNSSSNSSFSIKDPTSSSSSMSGSVYSKKSGGGNIEALNV